MSTILLADDSLTIQKVVELTFADTDYEVVAVSSGDELLRRLPETSPDIVICDVIMPGRDGYDVCQEIKSNPDSLHLPVILLTGTFEPFDRDRALAAGCSEIITKPFEARRLVEAVERLVSAPVAEEQAVEEEAPDVEHGGEILPPPEPALEPEAVAASEDFGTQLIETAPPPIEGGEPITSTDEGLDFTATGFAEMEAAGREQMERVPEPPAEGLEFEFSSVPEEADVGSMPDTESEVPQDEPALDTHPDDLSSDGVVDVISDDDAAQVTEPHEAAFAEFAPDGEEEEPVDDPFATGENALVEPQTVEPEAVDDALQVPADAEAEPVAAETTPPVSDFDTADGLEPVGDEVGEPVPDLSAQPVPAPEPVAVPEVSPESPPETEVESQPEVAPIPGPEPTMPTAMPGAATLSDEDIDKIARRVLEFAGDRIEHIAWEVIPDMAEIVVRERIRQIEAESDDSDSV